jgi:hypothetical protein
MRQIDLLTQEMEAANRSVNRSKCGSKVNVKYTPGCTSIQRLKDGEILLSGPDWCPTELVQQFNKANPPARVNS